MAGIPGSSFFRDPDIGNRLIRFAFCKRTPTLEAAVERLHKFAAGAIRR